MRESLFAGQADLLLEDGRGALREIRRARTVLDGRLGAALARDAPVMLKRARSGLSAAARGAEARDPVGFAGARGRVQAAVNFGSYRITLAAVRAGRARRAQGWLLVRDFRTPTRFTRPSADATIAARDLARGRTSRDDAGLAIKKDLLDAYQSKLRELLDEAAESNERGFESRRAEQSALAAGYWLILGERYREERDPIEAARANGTFRRLEAAGRSGTEAEFDALIEEARAALGGFTAAPFSPDEQARRGQQLLSFLDLVPIEYRDGTDDGRVTIAFEIQEAVAFRDGAAAAFADLESALLERDSGRTAELEVSLEELRVLVEDAAAGRKVVDEDEVESAYDTASAAVDKLFPAEWKESTADSDFDLIDLTLDRMEAAAGAGEWPQAEQARLEAYGFFEFGPEQPLRSLAPDVVAQVEGLVWYGAKGEEGYAQLIDRRAPRTDFRATRLALNESLTEGRRIMGDGASSFSVVTNSAVIVFREGLEAVLILAAVTAGLAGAAREKRAILFGVVLALIASGVTWVLAQTVLTSLAQYGEKLEAIVSLVALGVLLLVLNWFYHRVYWTEHIKSLRGRKKRAMALSPGGFMSAQAIGLVLLGFSTIYREGFETVLFLQALELNAGGWVVAEGVALGMVGVAAIAALTFVLQRKLPYKRMLVWTGVLIGLVLLVMVGKTVRTMQGVGWMSITPIDVELPFWAGLWFGVFPTVETAVAQLCAGVFVIGSYYLAERMRRTRPRPAAPVKPEPLAVSAGPNGNGGPPLAGVGAGEEPPRAGESDGA